ncbi:aspartate carbamoyltransferase regulatory subunit [Methanotrichaceae archaeon M04Ac]|jgi:aspartate carbamoyltransferase regulatory subunit|uniref:Aspartate carbamoyltransferase regulatory chain n=1 Tax=Candidatus Methanocrinis alkalitolerans TaxID=3033395 RepID=A0ABT5XGH5_9EURY|nr:aspartate carbamoyltransferase regulatory subunit [Candidatus Methanocrinis alkalitolerans]MCR3883191.1 aspartate carbamoyltransferase regulatory subunit [Methanothrix sp.]MDF0593592.1 aspartate carbamoyltransferase regulatory subunit [Candidatus Methanocrinis alkalitolerans]
MGLNDDEMKLRVTPIGNGTVIDHIPAGQALNVLKILGIDRTTEATISVLMNVASRRSGRKDVVKVEDRELKEEEVNKISLIAPGATINIIRDRKVVEKRTVDIPDLIVGVLRCPNPSCISNTSEPIKSHLLVKSKNPVVLRCVYCEQTIVENIADYLI